MFSAFINYLLAVSSKFGYLGIVLLMAVESSFVPLPSEIVVPPAAYLAKIGQMNIYLVFFYSMVGSLIGSSLSYLLGLTLGRKVIYSLAGTRGAKIFLINENKIKIAEDYFLKYGNSATFICRLIPGVRHIISIPAGFVKMNFFSFLLYTFLGAGIWNAFLCYAGYVFDKDFLTQNYHTIKISLMIFFAVFVLFAVFRIFKEKRRNDVNKFGK